MKTDKTIIKKYKRGTEPNDLKYWLGKTAIERLEALEYLRQQLYDSSTQRLQRVYSIVIQQNHVIV